MKKIIIFLYLLLFTPCIIYAQFRRLHIGDTMPNVIFNSVQNYSGVLKNFDDFSDKYIILDFWDRTCKACITGMPVLQELQKKFENKLQILLVTNNTKEGLSDLLKNSPIIKNIKLPIIFSDTVLTKHFFPYQYLPRQIWLDKNRKVLAITQSTEATSENILRMLADENLDLTVREDIMDDELLDELYSGGSSLLSLNNFKYLKYLCYYNAGVFQDDKGIISGNYQPDRVGDIGKSYSLFMRRIDGMAEHHFINLKDIDGKETGVCYLNISLENLYRIAFEYGGDSRYKTLGKLLLAPGVQFSPKPKDLSKRNKWVDSNSYCYETRFYGFSNTIAKKHLKNDLIRYFGVTAQKEKHILECIVFYYIDTTGKLNYGKETDPVYFEEKPANGGCLFSNMTFQSIVIKITSDNNSDVDLPILNETGLSLEKVNMNLRINGFRDLQILNSDLGKYGLGVKKENREIEVLVLSNQKYQNL